MSKYYRTGLGKLCPEKIIRALTAPVSEGGMGFERDKIEVGEKLPLYGFEGRQRSERGDIVIRRKHLRGAANDIGFERKKNGEWELIESGYDGGYRRDGTQTEGGGAQKQFKKRFRTAYKIETAKDRVESFRKSKRFKKQNGNWNYNGIIKREGTKIWVEIEEQ